MKPKHILYFTVSVLLGLAVLMSVFPKDGIKITKNFSLQFTNWDDFLNPSKNTDISEILQNNQVLDNDSIGISQERFDSVYIDSVLVVYKPMEISVDSTIQRIDLPKANDTLLFNLFKYLGSLRASGDKVHVLHYGDSQIEVDRMTSYFRYKLQSTFGGYGPGFNTGIQAFNFSEPMVVSYSNNWFRYGLFPHKDTLVHHRRFGLTTAFSMFKAINDTSDAEKSAWIMFRPSPTANSNARKYSQAIFYYGHNKSPFKLEVFDGETNISTEEIPENAGFGIKKWNFDHTPGKLKFVFTGKSSPEIYGYSFESYNGVMVDNLSVRGSAGLFFGSMDFGLLRQFYTTMNVRLILLQFGGNAVGGDSSSIKKFIKYFGAQIGYLQKLAPNAKIIVIGPGDMSEKYKNNYVTREKLPYLIDLLKKEALKRDCGFWNMYEAMGGKNSMPSWVFHNPPLAEKDFVHLSPQGSNIVAKMFYKSLMNEYNRFLNQQISK